MNYEMLVRLLLAALWGGIVGTEREYRGKSAGFRTMITISMGSSFFTMMSIGIGEPGNPDRIASNIVTGIGFLGAGVILRGDNRISGITTAASIWAVAAVGMGIGAGYYWVSAYASIIILVVLALLPRIETYIDLINQSKAYTIKCQYSQTIKAGIETQLKALGLEYKTASEIRDDQQLSITWHVQGHASKHQAFISAMMNDPAVLRFEY